jgi:hypothetical protein
MTNEQINIAIAKACGWAHPSVQPYAFPDYCNDLNAIHEAERSLNSQQVQDYTLNLLRVTNNDGARFHGTLGCFAHVHATARQRAEAFLKTLEKMGGDEF